MSVIQYNVPSQIKGINGFGLQLGDVNFSAILDADDEQTLAFPLEAPCGVAAQIYNTSLAIISAKNPVWVAINQAAEVAAGGVFAETSSVLLPAGESGITGKAGDVLHFISEDADNSISVRFSHITG